MAFMMVSRPSSLLSTAEGHESQSGPKYLVWPLLSSHVPLLCEALLKVMNHSPDHRKVWYLAAAVGGVYVSVSVQPLL